MPDVRATRVLRRWRLPALVTSITLVSGAAVVRSAVERLHNEFGEVRRLRVRLAAQQREIDRQRQELTAVATAVESLVPSAHDLGSRAMELGRAGKPDGGRTPTPEPVGTPTSAIEDGGAPRTMHTIATLAWVEERITDADEALAVQASLAGRRAEEARSVPSFWPVRGAVRSPVGWRASPYGGEREWHRGVDITAPYGTPVRATADGEVVFAGRARGYGVLVILDHGAASTRYAHLSAVWVRAGQTVLRGEPVGALGGTGRATGPHLHYEVRLGTEPLDPECLLSGPAGATFARSSRGSHACALARARLEGQGSPVRARDAAGATTSRAGAAG